MSAIGAQAIEATPHLCAKLSDPSLLTAGATETESAPIAGK